MDHLSLLSYCLLTLVALLAGIMDTLAGGGGLITLPAILMTGMNPVTALGTCKLQAAICEFSACWHFTRKKHIDYRLLCKPLICVMVFAMLGTLLLQFIPVTPLKNAIPWLLLMVLLYYLWSRRYQPASHQGDSLTDHKKLIVLGSSIGFYNGLFGPGTGSIWTIALMRGFNWSLAKATMHAKPLNMVGNLSALSIFFVGNRINYLAAFIMGIGSFLGGKLGAQLVIYKDATWLQRVFLTMIVVSTCLSFYQNYR